MIAIFLLYCIVPSSSPGFINITQFNKSSINISWNEIDCTQSNGRIIEYIVIISNDTITYKLTTTNIYIIVNNLVVGNTYNISVGGVNSIGRGPLSDEFIVEIGTGKPNQYYSITVYN